MRNAKPLGGSVLYWYVTLWVITFTAFLIIQTHELTINGTFNPYNVGIMIFDLIILSAFCAILAVGALYIICDFIYRLWQVLYK